MLIIFRIDTIILNTYSEGLLWLSFPDWGMVNTPRFFRDSWDLAALRTHNVRVYPCCLLDGRGLSNEMVEVIMGKEVFDILQKLVHV